MRTALVTLGAIAMLAVAGGALFVFGGFYNVSATQQHTDLVYWVMQRTMVNSVKERSEGIEAPDLSDPAIARAGLRHYREHCVQCHGAPGVPPADFAKGMVPLPPPLVQTAREWSAPQVFWAIKHGIKMTGMPAWDYRMKDEDIWAITAFVMDLPTISPVEYGAMVLAREEAR